MAAHVIEHSVDIIAFLTGCEKLLTDGGRLALVVPDHRFCFDLFKPLTSVGDAVDAHLRPTAFHTPGALLDHFAYACTLDGHIAWSPGQLGDLRLQFSELKDANDAIECAVKQEEYQDTHCWIFTPSSLSLLHEDLAELGFHSLHEVAAAPTNGFEFYLTLEKSPTEVPRVSRLDRLLQIKMELLESSLCAITGSGTHTSGKPAGGSPHVESWRVTAPARSVVAHLKQLVGRGSD